MKLRIFIFTIMLIKFNIYGQITYSLHFDTPILQNVTYDNTSYKEIKINNLPFIDTLGHPELPVKYVKFILPENSNNIYCNITNIVSNTLNLNNKIKPVQKPIPTGYTEKINNFIAPDSNIYYHNISYPNQFINIVDIGFFKRNKIITIAVYPCKYYPYQNKIVSISDIDFNISYNLNNSTSNNNSTISPETINEIKSIVENDNNILQFSQNQYSNKSTNSSNNYEYLIVTNQSLKPFFNEFMMWKKRKGINIKIETIENIYSNYNGDNISGIYDNAGKLRQFIADFYNLNPSLKYVLLGGDNTVLPIRKAYKYDNTSNDYYIIPTDLYFAEFDGDWEVDNDGRYGEPSDNVDFYPEVNIGRIMVNKGSEIINFTSKIINYEVNPGNGDYSYLTKAFLTQADQMQELNQANYIKNKLTWIDTTTIFEEQGGGCTSYVPSFPKGTDVVNEFNKHYGIVSFMTHGGACNVAVATLYYNSVTDCNNQPYNGNIENTKYKVTSFDNGSGGCCWVAEDGNGFDNFTNVNYPSINYSISCETMPFDDFGTPAGDRNMGETYTCISNGGGPAYLGNTRYGWVSASFELFKKFLNIFTQGTSYNIGVAEKLSQVDYNNIYLRFSHNLIGCPETEMWTNIPSIFNNVNITENGNNVYINANVNNVKICVMSALDNGDSYYEVASNVSSHTFLNVPKPYLVTITKHNYIPYLKNPDNLYIQNEVFNNSNYFYGKKIYAGYNITNQKPNGNVIIHSGSNVIFDAENETIIKNGFIVKPNSFFEIK